MLALVTLTAGCIGAMDDVRDDEPIGQQSTTADPGGTERVERTLVFTETIEEPAVTVGDPATSWSTTLGPTLVSMDLRLAWGEPANGFGLEIEGPEGTHTIEQPQDPSATSNEGEVPDPSAGSYAFHLTSEGALVPDEVELVADVVIEIPVDGQMATAGDGAQRSSVTVEETDDGYRATVEYTAEGELADEVDATVDTVNGAISLAADSSREQGRAVVTAWGEADTREEARERALSIRVDLTVEDDTLRATVEADDWEDKGASADVAVPERVRLSAEADTTNGAIQPDAITVDGFTADTTNGAIQGSLSGEGQLSLDTTNGAVDVAFTPTDDATIEAGTTNGAIELALTEDEATGYRIDASTTNGAITEDMDEASLQGSDEDATLRTQGYADREVQVDGSADTTNGRIHFASR